MTLPEVTIYTDGACSGNPGPGGWGVYFLSKNHTKKLHGHDLDTTNNRMELLAAIEALRALKQASHVELWTDSQYVQKGITEWMTNWKLRGWKTAKREPVKNVDLWQALDAEVAKHQVSWHWVKGHSGHSDNDRVDALANYAIDELLRHAS